MLGEKGTPITSNTIWTSKEKDRSRIDIENPKPGETAGQIHYQDKSKDKYIYDPVTDLFYHEKTKDIAPKSINDKLKKPDFRKAIDKGLCYLGEKN